MHFPKHVIMALVHEDYPNINIAKLLTVNHWRLLLIVWSVALAMSGLPDPHGLPSTVYVASSATFILAYKEVEKVLKKKGNSIKHHRGKLLHSDHLS